ncbi:uncharacterized protein LOC126795952 [Argentina anserina]|uniref:uncharacterized protein LOC126795952 n=1 Tax=Argentina anserina TaxID=57926 RepID=UPI0021766309|nr:uncharacterized protein LOC126795952 [Potentilla anserina]
MDPPPPPNPYPQPPFPTATAISAVPTAVEPANYNNNTTPVAHVAANPTQVAAPTFTHPPYAEMIYGAIAALKERDGSSRRAIAKYIEHLYPSLPPTHDFLLTQHLKRLKNSGHLEMVKKSYKIPGPPRSDAPPPPLPIDSAPPPSAASPDKPRGRGRPPKPKPELQQIPHQYILQQQMLQQQQQQQQQPIPIPQQPIPIPQQPFSMSIPQQPISISFPQQPISIPIPIPQMPIPIPQHPIVQPNYQAFPQPTLPQTLPEPVAQQQPNSQPMLVSPGPAEEPKKRPGRPRKAPAALAIVQNSPIVSAKRGRGRPPGSRMSKKRPGRPPKPKTVSSVSGPNGIVKRRPGRPSKAEPRTVFIPYNATNVPIIGAFDQSNGPNVVVPQPAPRPRGRPKKDKSAAASSGVAGVSGKPRGRPPLVPGMDRPKLSRSGRPVGRPRKDASLAITAAPDPYIAENAELKRKLEYLQSRVVQAVGVLKPFLNSGSAVDAAAAIQELEGLATMDISAPLIIATQQPALQS